MPPELMSPLFGFLLMISNAISSIAEMVPPENPCITVAEQLHHSDPLRYCRFEWGSPGPVPQKYLDAARTGKLP